MKYKFTLVFETSTDDMNALMLHIGQAIRRLTHEGSDLLIQWQVERLREESE